MSKHWGKQTGPWAFWTKLNSVWDIGGWPIAARLAVNQQEGVVFNVASPLFGSMVLGVYPDHRRPGCVTGFGVVRNPDVPEIDPKHYCWASKLPEFELGPDPRDLRDSGLHRAFTLYRFWHGPRTSDGKLREVARLRGLSNHTRAATR